MPQGHRVIYWNNVSKACENFHLYMYESVWIATVATRLIVSRTRGIKFLMCITNRSSVWNPVTIFQLGNVL